MTFTRKKSKTEADLYRGAPYSSASDYDHFNLRFFVVDKRRLIISVHSSHHSLQQDCLVVQSPPYFLSNAVMSRDTQSEMED